MSEARVATDVADVLLVEDNPGDVRLIEEMLDEAADRSGRTTDGDDIASVGVRHADRLADGLERLENEPVDVVLLDLGLPDSDGIETVEAVLERAEAVPIVVLTGLKDETVGDLAVQRGAQEYLVKDELTPMLLQRSLRHAIERKKFERTQTALHRASRELIAAESMSEVSRLTVETGLDVLDLEGIAVYLFDRTANRLEPVAHTDYLESLFGELPSFGPEDTAITWQAFIDGETITYDDVLESDQLHRRDTPLRSGTWIPLGDHGVLAIVSEDVGRFDRQTRQLADHLAATAETALERVEREESLREQERELGRQNRRLEELDRMNGIIREIDQVLVQATTRTAIERAVCELLTRDDRFAFAWIGEVVDDERVEPRTWAGVHDEYLDSVSLSLEGTNPPPAVATASSGSVTLVPNVAADLRGAPWRKVALARDLGSTVSVPLAFDGLTYGFLTVFATEPDAFDERATATFAELGETIANAMSAVETRQALLSDTVVELELVVDEPDDALGRLARATDCDLRYGGTVPQDDGSIRVFFGARGCPADEVRAVADDVPSITSLERITDADEAAEADDTETRFEMTVAGPTIPSTVVGCGAMVRSIRFAGSAVNVVVELPDTTDVRTFVDRFEETYPDSDLVARRDRERGDQSRQSFESMLTAELTDRQLETLQTAYLSGYFEWPRERTGEEVAASLGITQPTFNAHLRSAERKLCAMLFDGPSPAASTSDQ